MSEVGREIRRNAEPGPVPGQGPGHDGGRIASLFKSLADKKQKALVTFLTAGYPDFETSLNILAGLPKAGVDMIELGMPFSDPMADGPSIQAANMRALKTGMKMGRVLDLVRAFRAIEKRTPLILMGYYNPVYRYGVEAFLREARAAGVDGLIIVDLPPEEDAEMALPSAAAGLNFIRLVTPTTDAKRLPSVLKHASGFLYYVSILGITGSKRAEAETVQKSVLELKRHTSLPVAVGFGITNAKEAKAIAGFSDAVVIGTALIKRIEAKLTAEGAPEKGCIEDVLSFVADLAGAVHGGAARP